MTCVHKYEKQFLTALLVVFIVVLSPFSAFASSTGETSAQSPQAAGSLYEVASAFTGYVNLVVGPNSKETNSSSRLQFLDVKPGDAGAAVGYGEPKSGFYGYFSSASTNATTTTSYSAWKDTGLGDKNSVYGYLRYGRVLNELGIDSTGSVSGNSYRKVFGVGSNLLLNIGGFIPYVFDWIFKLLKFINPFSYLMGSKSLLTQYQMSSIDHGGFSNTFIGSIFKVVGFDVDAFFTNVAGFNFVSNPFINKVIAVFRQIYYTSIGLGYIAWIVGLAVLAASILIFKKTSNSSKLIRWVVRVAFFVIGIPLLGGLYTGALDRLSVESKSPAVASIVGSTFVDFNYIAFTYKGGLPFTVKSEVGNDSRYYSGHPTIDTVKKLRKNVLKTNSKLGLVTDVSSDSDEFTYTGSVFTEGAKFYANGIDRLSDMLSRYSNSEMCFASDWQSIVSNKFSTNPSYKSHLGHSGDATGGMNANKNTINEMFAETDDVKDWEDRTLRENSRIMSGGRWGSFSIFSGGRLEGTGSGEISSNVPNLNFSNFLPSADAEIQNTRKGFSDLTLYNYLSSEFSESQVLSQSSMNTTSMFSKIGHYSVNLIGSGFLRVAYGFNVFVCLFVISLFGYIYAFGLVVSLFKRTFQLITQLPLATMGVMKAIVQVIMYVVMMVCEILFTFMFYDVITDFLYGLGTLFVNSLASLSKSADGVVGVGASLFAISESSFAFAIGVVFSGVLVGVFGEKTWKYRRDILSLIEYCMCLLWRCFTLDCFIPAFDDWFVGRGSLYPWDFGFNRGIRLLKPSTSGRLVSGEGV